MHPFHYTALATIFAAVSTSAIADAPTTAGNVDLQKYAGKWYEQARLEMRFQRDCVKAEANYTLRDDGKVDVLNSCITKDGETKEAQGTAELQEAGKTDKLWVTFDNWFSDLFPKATRGDYWILDVDPNYQHAVVGDEDRDYLWILTREEIISDAQKKKLVEIAKSKGYKDTETLIWRGTSKPLDEIKQVKKDQQENLSDVREEQKSDLQKLKQEQAEKMQELQQKNAKELQDLKQDHVEEVKEVKQEQRDELR